MKTRTKQFGTVAALLLMGALPGAGAVSLVFSGTPGSSIINYTLSGAGIFSAGGLDNMIVVVALSSDPFDPIFNVTQNYGITGTGILTNTTTAQSTSLVNIRFDHDDPVGGGQDDLRLDFNSNLAVTNGDAYTISGNGTIDVSPAGATFSDFNLGTGSGIVTGSGLVVDGLSLTIVPEPSGTVLAMLGLVLGLRRRR
ncbi:MAG: hypothetical protein HKO57_13375 [Akkermansiaceae bacterium]|nr:hypothetical protein [Akkermansiaceae bacterium]